jgi:integrase
LVRDVSVGLKRMYAKPRDPKEPVEACDLIKCVGMADLNDLKQLRTVTLMVVSFMGFLRFDEVSQLRWSDIEFKEGYVSIAIRKSKTDQLREGGRVLIAQASSKACAVLLLGKYLRVSRGILNSDMFLFRAMSNNQTLRPCNKAMSYTSVREAVLEEFAKLGLKKGRFGLHSLRAGGATAAANRHVADRLFRRHGRWACDASKDLYVKDNIESLLSVSKSLGL